jgi:hypothetical protein
MANDVVYVEPADAELARLERHIFDLRQRKLAADNARERTEWKCFFHFACQSSWLIKQAE